MKLLLVAHYFLPFSIGGTEEHALAIAREMQQRGHDVHVFHGVLDQGWEPLEVRELVTEGISCTAVDVGLDQIKDFAGTYRRVEIDRIFQGVLQSFQPDVVHVHHLTRLSLGILDVARASGLPIVMTLHDFWMQCARGQRVHPDGYSCATVELDACAACMQVDVDYVDTRKPRLKRLLLRKGIQRTKDVLGLRRDEMLRALAIPDNVRTPSGFTRDAMHAYGVEREIEVAHNGVDVEPVEREPSDADGGRVRFGFLGRITATKGVMTLLDAFGALPDAKASLSIHGVMDAELQSALEERARDVGAQLMGPYHRDETGQLLASIDVLVVPSTWLECSPLVIQEASAQRIPVIVSDLGGLVELVREGTDGLRFRPGDPGDLARAMGAFLDDPGLVRRLGDARPAPLSVSAMVDRLVETYQSLSEAR